MCGSMPDIQSATAEIRRGKKKEVTTGQKYNGLSYYIGRPKELFSLAKFCMPYCLSDVLSMVIFLNVDISQRSVALRLTFCFKFITDSLG